MGQYTMQNGRLAVTIDDFGAELISIYDKKNDREIIWQADPAIWKRHAPILFPNVGKYYGGAFLHKGQYYNEEQHGFARDMMMERVDEGRKHVTHRLVSNEATKARYPFDFVLEVTHRLIDNRVTVEWYVKNTGDDEMYFTIGGHPGFNVPVLPDTKLSEYYLQFAEDIDALEFILIDPETGTAMPEMKNTLQLDHHRYKLQPHMFDYDALIFDDSQIAWAGIAMPDGTPYVSMSCEGFTNFGIWSVPGAPYVCLEPWCGRCDDQGFIGDISEKEGINMLEAGDAFEKKYVIEIG